MASDRVPNPPGNSLWTSTLAWYKNTSVRWTGGLVSRDTLMYCLSKPQQELVNSDKLAALLSDLGSLLNETTKTYWCTFEIINLLKNLRKNYSVQRFTICFPEWSLVCGSVHTRKWQTLSTFVPPGFIQPSHGNGLKGIDYKQLLRNKGEEARRGNLLQFIDIQPRFILHYFRLLPTKHPRYSKGVCKAKAFVFYAINKISK